MEYQRPPTFATVAITTGGNLSPPTTAEAESKKIDSPDPPLKLIGFKYDKIAPGFVSGRLPVTANICQPFNVLHGGVSAMVAEGLASLGAQLTGDRMKKSVGVHLSINHVRSARLGDVVFAEATPVNVGRTFQVWEVKLSKSEDDDHSSKKTMISSSRVTLLCSLPLPDGEKYVTDGLERFSKL